MKTGKTSRQEALKNLIRALEIVRRKTTRGIRYMDEQLALTYMK